ncbi:MBL fold metallo-hydrolase [bacterium]|nr:MBL fold metallo-hydrolase [bacterium]MBU2462166.1 MBL fold metallo-hydrolase [bacterium]
MADYIKFLGTAGARFAVARQTRASGGIWLSLSDTNIHIDPGPGALVRAISSKPKLDPQRLNGIILSHKHLDHSGDINVLIEAMTDSGRKKQGVVLCPKDSLGDDPVIFRYLRDYPERIEVLKDGLPLKIKDVEITPFRHIHSDVETYGMRFATRKISLSYIADTRFFPELSCLYKAEVIVICLLLDKAKEGVDHLCIEDVKRLIAEISPNLAILTHFGMTILKGKPKTLADEISALTGIKTIAAYDGMKIEI